MRKNKQMIGLSSFTTLLIVVSLLASADALHPAAAAGLNLLNTATAVAQIATQAAESSQKTVVVQINLEGLSMINGLNDCYYNTERETSDERRSWVIGPAMFCGTLGFEAAIDDNELDKQIYLRFKNTQNGIERVFHVKWLSYSRKLCVGFLGKNLICLNDFTNQPQFKTMEEDYQSLNIRGETFKSSCYGGFDLANSYPDTGTIYCNILPNNNRYNYVMELTGHNNCYFTQDLANFVLINADETSSRYFENMGLNSAWFKIRCNGQYVFDIRNYRHNFKFTTTSEGLVFQKDLDVGAAIRYTAYENDKSVTCVTTKEVLRNMYTIKNSCKVNGY